MKRIIVALATLAVALGLMTSPAQAADMSAPETVAAQSGTSNVWLYTSPNQTNSYDPRYVPTSQLGPCYYVDNDVEILSAVNLSQSWKIRFYRGSYCNGEWGHSTIWEYGSGHTYYDNCICYSGGGAQSFRRISTG